MRLIRTLMLSLTQWQRKIQKIEKINAIMEDPERIMLVVKQKKIKFIHSCKKFGGTRTNPTTTVVGLIGQGARAFPIVIDSDKTVTSQEVTVPLDARIWACKDATKLKELDNNATASPVTMGTRTRSQRGATAEDTTPPPDAAGTATAALGNQKYLALPVFIPLPIPGVTAFECISDDPLTIIKVIKSAATNFDKAHKDSNPKFDDARTGAKLFAR
jgi:hypothetical protein